MPTSVPGVLRPRASVAALLLLWVVHMPSPAAAQPSPPRAGRVKIVAGAASLVRGGQVLPATPGAEVFESDVLRTGPDGRLSVMFADDSRVSLGPDSELALTRFAYAPADAQLGLGLRLARGALSYVSGLIAKLSPDAVRLQTPTSIIGVRGTHVLVKADAP